jgi:hypothetical protein
MIDLGWIQRLLSSATDLHHFEIRGDDHLLKLSHGPTGTFHWPRFRHIHTEDLFVHHDEWTAFLRLHTQTLEVVSLSNRGFPHGQWMEPLAIIETMSRLKRLWLFKLLEQAPYPRSSMKLRRSTMDYVSILQLHSVEQVKDALSAMRRRPRTVFTDYGVGGERYPYAVDFASGNAAAMGKTVYEDGQEDEDDEEDMETDIETDIEDESEDEDEEEDV